MARDSGTLAPWCQWFLHSYRDIHRSHVGDTSELSCDGSVPVSGCNLVWWWFSPRRGGQMDKKTVFGRRAMSGDFLWFTWLGIALWKLPVTSSHIIDDFEGAGGHSFQVLVLLCPWSKIASASWICQFGQFGHFDPRDPGFIKLRTHSTQTGQGDRMRHKQLLVG